MPSEIERIIEAIEELSKSIKALSSSVDKLGFNNASTPMGAIEMLSIEVKEGLEGVSESISSIKSNA